MITLRREKLSAPSWIIGGLTILLFGTAILLGGWTDYPKAVSQFRNPTLFILVVLAIVWTFKRDTFSRLVREWDPEGLRVLLLALSAFVFLKATLLDYLTFSVNGLDGSIYDYAMMNTLRGRFMESVNGRNHFGIHATPILFLLMPFHAVFHSPLFVLFLHPIVLWFGAWLFDRCLAARKITGWTRLGLLFAYLSSIWISRTLAYSFHIEIFYPVAFFLLDLSLFKSDSLRFKIAFWSCAALILTIKEDAPFHLIGFCAAYFVLGKLKLRPLVWVSALSLIVFIFYFKFVVPMNSPSGKYELVGSVAASGNSLGEAFKTFLLRPGHFVVRYFTGEWWLALWPSLGLLLASPFFWIASAPILGLYTLMGNSQMFSITMYYAIPVVAPFFLGLAEGAVRVPTRFRNFAIATAVIGISTIGSGYLVFRHLDFEGWQTTHEELAMIPKDAAICAPGILVPQLPYGNIKLIDPECLTHGEYAVIAAASSEISRYPFSPSEDAALREILKTWEPVDGPSKLIDTFRKR